MSLWPDVLISKYKIVEAPPMIIFYRSLLADSYAFFIIIVLLLYRNNYVLQTLFN